MADRAFPKRVRINHLTKVIRRRCGRKLPDDDAGREYLTLMFDHHAHLPDGRDRSIKFVEIWAEWLDATEMFEMIDASSRVLRWWKADELGRELNLTFAERHELGVTTIAPADISAAELNHIRRRRKADRERERRRRHARPQLPHMAGDLSDRAAVVLQALHLEHRWFTVPELATMTRLRFKDARGRVVADGSMGKLLARTLNELAAGGLISDRRGTTKTGLATRSVRASTEQTQRSGTGACHDDTVTTQ